MQQIVCVFILNRLYIEYDNEYMLWCIIYKNTSPPVLGWLQGKYTLIRRLQTY